MGGSKKTANYLWALTAGIFATALVVGVLMAAAIPASALGQEDGSTASVQSVKELEQQLKLQGAIGSNEVIVVEREYTSTAWRSELTPMILGGMPFGTYEEMLMGGASFALHVNSWLALEVPQFLYVHTFSGGILSDLRNNNPGKYFELDTDRIVFLVR